MNYFFDAFSRFPPRFLNFLLIAEFFLKVYWRPVFLLIELMPPFHFLLFDWPSLHVFLLKLLVFCLSLFHSLELRASSLLNFLPHPDRNFPPLLFECLLLR